MTSILKMIKYVLTFLIFSALGALVGAVLCFILEITTGIYFDYNIMLLGFALIVNVAGFMKVQESETKKKETSGGKQNKEKTPMSDVATLIRIHKQKIDILEKRVQDKNVKEKVKNISATFEKIAKEVDEDPRDRKRVRALAEHTAAMIVDLVEKYIKMQGQNQSSDNISSVMKEIATALESIDESLKTLLDDLFSNDVVEVASTIAVLENILATSNPDNRIHMKKPEEGPKEIHVKLEEKETK